MNPTSESSLQAPIKVAQFLGTMRPDHDGVTRVTYRLRDEFKGSPFDSLYLSAIVPEEEGYPDVKKVPSVTFLLHPDYQLSTASVAQLDSLLGDFNPKLIHIHSPCTLGHAAVKLAKKRGIPVVATYHTHFPTYLKYYGIQFLDGTVWRILKKLYSRCDRVIVPSIATLEDLKAKGIPNLVHIPHGVDTSSFSPAHRSEEWRSKVGADGKVLISFVSRLVWEKNLKILSEAHKKTKHRDKARFVIVGDGPALDGFRQQFQDAYFTGFLRGKELQTAYASSDLFVMPSVTETFGNVTVEAMASGVPAICAAAGGARDFVIPGENGLLAKPNDVDSLAEAMDRLIEDSLLRARMSAQALESSKRFAWSNTAHRYQDLYRSLL
jgi:phosphatidylinositol alpha 1,6-mannosyltransferase